MEKTSILKQTQDGSLGLVLIYLRAQLYMGYPYICRPERIDLRN